MAKHWSATSLVALALLGCLVWTETEAQMSKGSPPPQAPKILPRPQPPQVLPPPKDPQYPQPPQVRPPPKDPQYPQPPQVLPPPRYPQYPQPPQVRPPPKDPQYPQPPQVRPPPKDPQYPQPPQVRPPPTYPQHPQPPQVRPPPTYPQHPQPPQVLPPPKDPQYPQPPQVRPPPTYPQHPQPPQVRPPPTYPQHPQPPQVRPPPKDPKYPQPPQVRPPPTYPQHPQPPQVLPPPRYPQHPQPPQVLPPPRYPQHPQPPQVRPPPTYPQHPQPPQVRPPPKDPKHPQVFHDQVQQVPQRQHPGVPQTPKESEPVQSCEVAASVRIPCGHPDISAAGCEAINCCFDGRQCYFGKAVTVQCTKDAQFIVVVARDATLPNIDLESISLAGEGQGCTHVDSNSHFAIYQFPVTGCGSVVMEEPGVIIYENRMSSSYEVGVGPLGAITRDSYFEVLFQCRYIGTSVETVVVDVAPLQDPPLPAVGLGPIRVALRLANGQCFTKGCNEVDVAYSSFFTEADYPVTKVLRDPVYVEVQLLEKTDPMLVLTLGRCWTTISPNPHSLPQWDILIDGCPYRDDRYLSSLVPVDASSGLDFPSHYRRFLFKMFTFVDPGSLTPMREQVYIHCSTAVCSPVAGGSCEPSCYRKSRKRRDAKAVDQKREEPKVVASVGPVIIGAPEEE
ncbi:zona pellucida sperm-binding protein 4-like [Thunnus albacares]|uniref:zona pellucida sperm-binding protein 4-like n=1 Tax=Thunnus albacares TaxID=8236 RepID=UPI001CF6594E|nr:zona pellucida sperm-binding protein 4-like [Thunnus albacares]